jgi:hypothetical protein
LFTNNKTVVSAVHFSTQNSKAKGAKRLLRHVTRQEMNVLADFFVAAFDE